MSDSMRAFADEMKQYVIEEDVEIGVMLNSQKTAKLFAKHYSVEDIADTLDVEQVEDWLGLARA